MSRRPLVPPRVVVAGGAVLFVVSVAGWALLAARHPEIYWRQTDLAIYRDAGLAVRHDPLSLYTRLYGTGILQFAYPPFAALVFATAGPLRFTYWQLAVAMATLAGLLASGWAALALAGVRGPARWAGTFAVAAVGMWLEPVDLTLWFGQVNVVLLALVLLDLAVPDRYRCKGIGIGLAAAIKLTPLIFIGYLLVSRRIRAAAVAMLTFAATVAVGFVFLGRESAQYWGGRYAEPADGPGRLVNQSLNGFLLRLFGGSADVSRVWLVASVLVLVAGLGAAALASRRGEELLGVCLTGAVGLLISPISWSHHWVWVLPAAVLAVRPLIGRPTPVAGWLRTVGPVAGVVAVGLLAWWPLRLGEHGGIDPRIGYHPSGLFRIAPHDDGAELHWTAWQVVYGDSYVLIALAFVLAAGVALLLYRSGRPADAPAATRPGKVPVSAVALR